MLHIAQLSPVAEIVDLSLHQGGEAAHQGRVHLHGEVQMAGQQIFQLLPDLGQGGIVTGLGNLQHAGAGALLLRMVEQILMNFLNNNNLPRGLIIQHYDAAQALASILECKHIRVPEDVKIFTFVHSREQNRFPMLLQFPREIGRKAAQGVLNRLRWPNNIPCNYMIPAQLVEP